MGDVLEDFPSSLMVKCWRIFEVGNERVGKGSITLDCVNLLARMRLKGPSKECPMERSRDQTKYRESVEVFG